MKLVVYTLLLNRLYVVRYLTIFPVNDKTFNVCL